MDNSTLSSAIVLILELRDLERRLAEASYGWKTSKVNTLHSAANMLQQLSDRVNSLETENAALLRDLGSTPSACDFCTGEDCKRNVMDSGGCHFIWRGPKKKS